MQFHAQEALQLTLALKPVKPNCQITSCLGVTTRRMRVRAEVLLHMGEQASNEYNGERAGNNRRALLWLIPLHARETRISAYVLAIAHVLACKRACACERACTRARAGLHTRVPVRVSMRVCACARVCARRTSPTMDECARCAVPKASFT
eukprot:6185380-Pleurochrysis_carterae.AAC.2